MDFIYSLLYPLEWVVAWLMVSFHQLFTSVGFKDTSGFTWAMSIVGLVIVIRIVLIPLFVKQIHAQRRMQLIQPEIQKIQNKYKGKTDPESNRGRQNQARHRLAPSHLAPSQQGPGQRRPSQALVRMVPAATTRK